MQECIPPVLYSEVLGGDALSLDRGAFKAMRAFQFEEQGEALDVSNICLDQTVKSS